MSLTNLSGLYPIIDQQSCLHYSPFYLAEMLIANGVKIIQYRNKFDNIEFIKTQAGRLQTICVKNSVTLVLNDYWKLAKDLKLSGVHLGQTDTSIKEVRSAIGNKTIIGSSNNKYEQIRQSEEQGFDYISFGAMFRTTTKSRAVLANRNLLAKIKIKVPLCVIGGINATNLSKLLKYSPNMVAVCSVIVSSKCPETVTKQLIKLIEESKK